MSAQDVDVTVADTGADAVLSRTRHELEEGIRLGWHTGGQVSVVVDGRRLDVTAGEIEPGRAMTPRALYPLFCAAKPVLALGIAQQLEAGALGLDDPVAEVVPEFAASGKEAVTLRHVLLHTSGFMADPATAYLGRPWDEVVAGVCAAPLEPGVRPGERACYQLFSFWYVVGEVLRRVTGQPLSAWLNERVITALRVDGFWVGMPEAVYAAEREWVAPIHASRYETRTAYSNDFTSEEVCCGHADYSPRATVGALADFYAALLDGRSAAVISPETLALVVTRHREGMVDELFGTVHDVGLGVQLESRRYGGASERFGRRASDSAFGHFGAFGAAGFADPEVGVAVAFGVNGAAGSLRNRQRAQALFTAVYDDLGLAPKGGR